MSNMTVIAITGEKLRMFQTKEVVFATALAIHEAEVPMTEEQVFYHYAISFEHESTKTLRKWAEQTMSFLKFMDLEAEFLCSSLARL